MKHKRTSGTAGMLYRLIVFRRCYGMEMNVGKNCDNENLNATIPITDYDKPKNRTMWSISVTCVVW
jgi:hypothetical protein